MAYTDEIARTEQEYFAELYRFRVGGEYYFYTTYETDIVFQGNTYVAMPFKRSSFSYDTGLKASHVTIQCGITDVAQQFIANTMITAVYVDIIRIYPEVSGTPYINIFNGKVMSVKLEGIFAAIDCISDNGLMERNIPRIYYQTYCNHRVFDQGCGANEYLYRVNGTVATIVSETEITVAAAAGYANDYFTRGVLMFGSDQRLITDHTGSTLKLLFGMFNMPIGSAVVLVPGCDGAPGTCRSKFNNLNRYMGFPYIPTDNPVIWGFR